MSDLVNKLVRATRNITIFDMNGVGDRRSLEDAYHGARYDVAERIEHLEAENAKWIESAAKQQKRAKKAEAALADARRQAFEEAAQKARKWAAHYPHSSDGRNTFTLFAEWADDQASQCRSKAQPHSETRQEQSNG